ncbi:hypothetical protein OROHE_013062 [Orobanche hederae]
MKSSSNRIFWFRRYIEVIGWSGRKAPMGSLLSSLLGGEAAAAESIDGESSEPSRVTTFHSSARWKLHFDTTSH